MKKSRKYGNAKSTLPRPMSGGTPLLGRVIPELAICGVFDVTDAEVLSIAKSISTAILAQFQMELLQASGLIGNPDNSDD